MAKALGFQTIDPTQDLATQLEQFAPAALSKTSSPITSEHYEFVDSMNFIEAAQSQGWQVTSAGQRIKRVNPEETIWGKHMLKLEHPDYLINGKDKLQMVMVNSHNRMAKFRLDVGIFRMICSNGLIIKSVDLMGVNQRHRNFDSVELLKTVMQSMEHIQEFAPKIEAMQHRIMTKDDQFAFAIEAIALRHGQEVADVLPKAALNDFLAPLRDLDKGDDLWKIFNVSQEKLIRGGYVSFDPKMEKLRKQQAISSAEKDYNINTQLSDVALNWLS